MIHNISAEVIEPGDISIAFVLPQKLYINDEWDVKVPIYKTPVLLGKSGVLYELTQFSRLLPGVRERYGVPIKVSEDQPVELGETIAITVQVHTKYCKTEFPVRLSVVADDDKNTPIDASDWEDSYNSASADQDREAPKRGTDLAISVSSEGILCDSLQHISNVITELILAHEAGGPLPSISVNLEELALIEAKLSTRTRSMPNAERLELVRHSKLLRMLKQYIERSIRILAIGGRIVLFDPDDIASCFPTILCELNARCGLQHAPRPKGELSIDVFRNDRSGITILVPLERDEVREVLRCLGPANPPLSAMQVSHSCADLPPDVRLLKAFPAMIVAVVWARASENDDVRAADLCNYDHWLFGLA